MGAFGEFIFQKLVTNQLFVLEFFAVRQDTFYPQQDYEQVICYSKSSFYFTRWSFRNWKIAAFLQLAINWDFSTKVQQNSFFIQHSQPLYDITQKDMGNLEFLQGVNFEFIDSLKNNGTNYLLIFDDSCEEVCISKASVDIATAGDIGV